MKIFVVGTRGIPDIPGGVEKHCQELYPRIAARGHNVRLCTRACYMTTKQDEWQGVKLIPCFASRKKSLEALTHTLVALVKARWCSPDIVHIHGIGPSLLTPLARLMGLKVVVTNHGPDYDRQKWGKVAKLVLRLGEMMGALYANEVIVISGVIKDLVGASYERESHLIPNGVTLSKRTGEYGFLDQIGVEPGRYVLAVARFVPEKGLHDLINAFKLLTFGCKLVIAGDADHETDYSTSLRQIANKDKRIILTGYVTGQSLAQLYSHARLFVLPSYHEGLPIVVLEAMSYGLSVLVSDIPANREIGLPQRRYFRCGDVDDLRTKMELLFGEDLLEEEREEVRKLVDEKYNWEKIAEQTITVYQKALE